MNKFITIINQNKWLQFTVMVLLNIAMSIGIEELTDQQISGAEILFIRAICNLVFVILLAATNKKSIIPKKPALQTGAFICLGLSLLLFFSAYQFISAGSVSTLQRLDIPLLAVISLFTIQFSLKQFVYSLFAFSLVVALLLFSKTTDEDPFGYVLVVCGVIVIAINTLLQKKIAANENIVSIMFVISLSSVFWGGIRCWQSNSTFKNITLYTFLAIFLLSLVNLVVFYLVNDLYKKHSPEYVRYPYLVAAFCTMIVEMIVEDKVFNSFLIIGNVAILIILTLLVKSMQDKNKIQASIIDKEEGRTHNKSIANSGD